MNLTFGITGACVVKDADYKPSEEVLACVIQEILKRELDILAIIYVNNMCEITGLMHFCDWSCADGEKGDSRND